MKVFFEVNRIGQMKHLLQKNTGRRRKYAESKLADDNFKQHICINCGSAAAYEKFLPLIFY